MHDVIVVGGGVAGLTAGIYTARAEMDTLVVDAGESILARNASLENYPGFPDGVDARRFLGLTREQADAAGCSFERARVTGVEPVDVEAFEQGFVVETEDGGTLETRQLIAASWPDSEYLVPLDVGRIQRGSKHLVQVDEGGRTAVDGVYAAGRIAGVPHQTVVAAGHGATVAIAAIHDAEVPFYHDWVAPEGYFTGRGRDVPPGIEEIDDEERRARDERARETMCERLADSHDGEPTMHPSVDTGE